MSDLAAVSHLFLELIQDRIMTSIAFVTFTSTAKWNTLQSNLSAFCSGFENWAAKSTVWFDRKRWKIKGTGKFGRTILLLLLLFLAGKLLIVSNSTDIHATSKGPREPRDHVIGVRYIWNNSYLNCGRRLKWRMIIAVTFPIQAIGKLTMIFLHLHPRPQFKLAFRWRHIARPGQGSSPKDSRTSAVSKGNTLLISYSLLSKRRLYAWSDSAAQE